MPLPRRRPPRVRLWALGHGVRCGSAPERSPPRRVAQELEAMKARLKEMEDEAAKLRQMQARRLRVLAPFLAHSCHVAPASR